MTSSLQVPSITDIEQRMRIKVPSARLRFQILAKVPQIELALIDPDYPQADLTSEQIDGLMDDPPYWAFCWASGQVLAHFLLENPALVRDEIVFDFGCGSGVVAIAAALAGAHRVIAVDVDESALMATRFNAHHNGVRIETQTLLTEDLALLSKSILLVADVFYDADNLAKLPNLLKKHQRVWVADSRVKSDALPGLKMVTTHQSHTVPDLAEASHYNQVSIYKSAD